MTSFILGVVGGMFVFTVGIIAVVIVWSAREQKDNVDEQG